MVEDRLPGLLGQGLHLQRPHDLPDGHGGVEAVRTRPGPAVKEPPVQVVHQFVSCRPNDLFTLLTHLHYLLSRPGLAAPADIEVKSALSS